MRGLTFTQCYVDDIMVHSSDAQTHLDHLQVVFGRLRTYNLKLNIAKCVFSATSVTYLGHLLSADGVRPSLDLIKAVKDFPTPTSVKNVKEFCGLTNYFRNHIRNFARLCGNLTRLTRKDVDWSGGPLPEEAMVAFETLKSLLCAAPVLAYPLPNKPYFLACDAATGDESTPGGLGAILSQKHDQVERVVAYASRSLKDFEKNYTPFLLESAAICWAIDHFHVYLYGRRFTVFTDHRPVVEMSRLHQKTLSRLQEQMNKYTFICLYRKGEDNAGPDALSRNPVDVVEAIKPDLVRLQKSEGVTRLLWNYLTRKILPKEKTSARQIVALAAHCLISEGLLQFNLVRRGMTPRLAIMAPDSMRKDIIRACHTHRFAGHAGVHKTVHRIQQEYFWPGMTTAVAKFISTCQVCQRSKNPPSQIHKAPLMPLELQDWPNERVHIDLMGPLRTSDAGKKFVMVITDAFTKYVVVCAIADKEAKTVAAEFFNAWITLFSVPKVLVSDRGKEFCNSILTELCKLLGTEKRMTAAYHPQSNSAAESYNRSFIKYLKAALDGHSTLDWEQFLPALSLAYNTQIHRATLHSPFFLTFLHDPRMPYFDFEKPTPIYCESWAKSAFARLQEAYALAKNNNKEASEKAKEYYDERVKSKSFYIGDKVLISFPPPSRGGNRKFVQPWRSGFYVSKVLGPLTFEVRATPTSQPHVVHVNRMKLLLHESAESPVPAAHRWVKRQQAPTFDNVELFFDEEDGMVALPQPAIPAPLIPQPALPAVPAAPMPPPAIPIPPPQPPRAGLMDGMDWFLGGSRATRSKGPAAEVPHVQPHTLERKPGSGRPRKH